MLARNEKQIGPVTDHLVREVGVAVPRVVRLGDAAMG